MVKTDLIFTPYYTKPIVWTKNFLFTFYGVWMLLFVRGKGGTDGIMVLIYGETARQIGYWGLTGIPVLITLQLLSRKMIKKGKIELDQRQIMVTKDGSTTGFDLAKVTQLSVRKENKFYSKITPGIMSTQQNFIAFDFEGSHYEFQFLLDSYYHQQQFKSLTEEWEKSNLLNGDVSQIKTLKS